MPSPVIKGFKPTGGSHPETAALRSVLSHHGVRAPHTGRPFSEPMLLGLGGGLGAGYILWEFKKHASATLVLGLRYKWNYPVQFMTNVCRRTGVRVAVKETCGAKAAAANLDAALSEGLPAIVWVHEGGLAYRHVPRDFEDCWGWLLTIYGTEDGGESLVVEDLGRRPFRVPADQLAAARAKIPSYKNRLMVVRPGTSPDLAKSIMAGVQDCVKYLTSPSDSFSLPAIRKWARLMTDTKNTKGWPRVFRDGHGLFTTLRCIYEGIKHKGCEGAGLRFLYADFLREAAGPAAKPGFKEAASLYRRAGNQWIRLANIAFSERVTAFRTTRELLDRKYRLLQSGGHSALQELGKIGEQLSELYRRHDRDFPLEKRNVDHLFGEIQAGLTDLFDIEQQAIGALKDAVH
jgi:hypothetical protein